MEWYLITDISDSSHIGHDALLSEQCQAAGMDTGKPKLYLESFTNHNHLQEHRQDKKGD